MLLFQDFGAYAAAGPRGGAAVTIGNFDGCHLGHQALIQAAINRADEMGGPAVGVAFAPRPEAYFRGLTREVLLFTDAQKTRALAETGLDVEILKTFDEAFSRMSADDFYGLCLRQQLGARAIVVGHNFRFGHGRAGDAAYLLARGQADDLEVVIGEAVAHQGEIISSTRIRARLADGAVEDVSAMLGRPYLLEGHIAKGDQLGRKLGVPTANLEGLGQLLPRYGIYAGYVWLSEEADDQATIMDVHEEAIPAVYSIGVRPTLDQAEPPLRVEAHLLQGVYGDDALYGKRAGYYLTHRLRDEIAFDDMNALKAQMAADIVAARRLL